MYVLLPPKCNCEGIYRYYSCSCFFDSVVKIILPSREHVCFTKIKSVLRNKRPDDPFFFRNDRHAAAAVVCHDCIERFFWLDKYTKKYFDKDQKLYYSVSVSNRIKKFDVKGAKRYFMKNVDKFLPVILANKQNFY